MPHLIGPRSDPDSTRIIEHIRSALSLDEIGPALGNQIEDRFVNFVTAPDNCFYAFCGIQLSLSSFSLLRQNLGEAIKR